LKDALQDIADQACEIQTDDKNNKCRKQPGDAGDKKSKELVKIGLHRLSPS
jgi:hypothetical protein